MDEKKSVAQMTNDKFSEIMKKIASSHTMIPSEALLSIMGGVVGSANKDSKAVKDLATVIKDNPVEDIISKTVLFTCNSIVTSIWTIFGKQIEEAYDKVNSEKKDA